MSVENYILSTIIINFIYLLLILRNKNYRLILPSTIACFTWLVACLLMYAELRNWFPNIQLAHNAYSNVAEFIFGMNLCAIIGFILAHQYIKHNCTTTYSTLSKSQTLEMCDQILIQFKWILWICVGVGITLIIFFMTLGLNINSFSDYRLMAVTVEKVGYAALAKRIGGHIGILGTFYLIILGYKQSQSEVDLRKLIKCILMYSSVNLAIGGRVWLMASTLPYITGYLLGNSLNSNYNKSNLKKISIVLFMAIVAFSVMGNLRSDDKHQLAFFEKFLYYTDGPKMANIVMNTFPEGTYPLEYGNANFLQFLKQSPMTSRFNESIKDNIALSVTVRSNIPSLYYDFGFYGGMIAWGIICGLLEAFCLSLRHKGTLFSILLFGTCAVIPFQSPVGSVFVLAMPSFEWLLLLWLFRGKIFNRFNPETIPYKMVL